MMAFLTVTNGITLAVSGLGKKTPLHSLTGAAVASASRDALRQVYRKSEFKMSRAAKWDHDGWIGRCRILGVEFTCRVSEQLSGLTT